jgi:hypothetical protein
MHISLTGAAGAATGFARTLPMKGRARQRSWIARVRISKSDSGSKPKACGIRADSRLVFSHVSTLSPPPSELDSRRFKRGLKARSGEQSEALRLRRFAVGFFSCVKTNSLHEIETHLRITSVFSVKITPRNSYSNMSIQGLEFRCIFITCGPSSQ